MGSRLLPGGTGDVGGDDIGGMPVEAAAGTVVADRGPRIGVRGGSLDIPQGDASVEGCGDERVAERVRPHLFSDPGPGSGPADDPGGAVPVQPLPARSQEDRPLGALADGQVDRPCGPRRQRDSNDLAAPCG